MASTWCEQSLDIVSGFNSEKWARTITSRQWMVGCQQSFACATAWSRHFLSLSLWKSYSPVEILSNRGLIIKNVWHVSTNFTDTIWNFRLPRRDRSSLWISEHNAPTKLRYFGYKIIFMEQKEHLLCNCESECKHPKIIKGKWFILLLFWFVTNLLCC